MGIALGQADLYVVVSRVKILDPLEDRVRLVWSPRCLVCYLGLDILKVVHSLGRIHDSLEGRNEDVQVSLVKGLNLNYVEQTELHAVSLTKGTESFTLGASLLCLMP